MAIEIIIFQGKRKNYGLMMADGGWIMVKN